MPVPIAELFVTVGADISGLTNGLNQANAQLARFGTNLKNATQTQAGGLQNVSKQVTSLGSDLRSTGTQLSLGLTAPIVGAIAAVGGVGASFDHAFTGVRKTVNASDDQLAALRAQLVQLSATPAGGGKTFEQLSDIAKVGGQLGIPTEAIAKFTEVAAKLSVATDIPADQIGEAVARIATLSGLDIKNNPAQLENMGSAITQLGNDMKGSERDIVDVADRITGALAAVNVSPQNILGIASAVAGVSGGDNEAAASAIQRIFLQMTQAVAGLDTQTPEAAKKLQDLRDRVTDLGASLQTATERQATFGRNTPQATVDANTAAIAKYQRELGQAQAELDRVQQAASGGQLAEFAKVTGLSADQFKKLFAEDPAKAFQLLIHGLAQISATQGPTGVVKTLDALDIKDVRLVRTILNLTNASQDLDDGLRIANEAWAANSALNTEAAKKMEDPINKFQLFQQELRAIADAAWPAFRKAMLDLIDAGESRLIPFLQSMLLFWKNLGPEMQRNVLIFAAVVAAIGPLVFIIGTLLTVLGFFLTPFGAIIAILALLTAAWLTNFGDIQGKTAAVVDFIKGTALPAIGGFFDQLGTKANQFATFLDPVTTAFKSFLSFMGQIEILLVTLWDRMMREFKALWEGILLPTLQTIGTWIADNIGGALLGLIQFIAGIASSLGLTSVGGVDIPGLLAGAESAVANLSKGVAAGGPGQANDIVVNINNPSIPNQTVGDRFAQQVQDAIITVLVGSEARTVPLPQPAPGALPGQPF